MDERFLRNEMLWGKEGQARLTAAHVIVFGLGGVGSYVAECLAGRCGRADAGGQRHRGPLQSEPSVGGAGLHRGASQGRGRSRRVRDINPYAVLHPMEACTTPTTGNSSSLQAAGMTTLWTPLIW